MNSEMLKVSSKSNPNSVAGAIAGIIAEKGKVELQAIGAGAINQVVKAIAIARGFVAGNALKEADQEVDAEDNNKETKDKVMIGKIEGKDAEEFIKMIKKMGVE